MISAGFYDLVSPLGTGDNITVGYTNAFTTSTALGATGFAQEVLVYTPSGVPEPGTLFLMGTALVGAGLIRRRRKS